MVRACFETADLYDLTMVDNEPDFGEMAAMASFFVGVGGRDVACNVSTGSTRSVGCGDVGCGDVACNVSTGGESVPYLSITMMP